VSAAKAIAGKIAEINDRETRPVTAPGLQRIAVGRVPSRGEWAEDLELSPFNQRGGLGKAHQLFGEELPKLLDELNEVLAA